MSAETGALLAGEDPYANFNADIPPSTTNVLAVVCKTVCCCWNKKNAAANNPGRSFPRTPVEFRDAGAVWATSVLRDNGRIDRSNSVVSVKVSELGASGLLSELCLASLTLAKPVEGIGEVVVKFSPGDATTRLTLNLFELSKTEYLAYEKMLPHLPASIKVPKMVGGDFNFTSHKVCMMLERVDQTLFLDQDSDDAAMQPTVAHFERIFETLAVLHAHFWTRWEKPGLAWINRTDNEVYKIFPKEVKKHWGTFEAMVADPGPAASKERVPFPRALTDMKNEFIAQLYPLLCQTIQMGLTTITHGDPRLDNVSALPHLPVPHQVQMYLTMVLLIVPPTDMTVLVRGRWCHWFTGLAAHECQQHRHRHLLGPLLP